MPNNLVTALLWGLLSACMTGPVDDANPAQERAMPSAIPVLPEASDLAGAWRLEHKGTGCNLILELERLDLPGPHAAAWRLTGDAACLIALEVGETVGWRPAPDGVALLRVDGSVTAFLSRAGAGFQVVSGDRTGLSLSRR